MSKQSTKTVTESEILLKQPVVSIGLCGHVDHGKTTLLEKLSGKWADTHSEELKRGITIRLGYADVVFNKCSCEELAYTTQEKCQKCGSETTPVRKVSFVDAPGHESLMATMLSGAAIIDGALILVSATEKCPQPQTREHLRALEIVGIKNVVIVQNKIDLVDKETAISNYKEIKEFLRATIFENAPIIPISAEYGANIDKLIWAIEKYIPTPDRDLSKDPLMLVARSFDINKPGTYPKDMKGGVLGGALKIGRLKINQDIEIRPGRMVEEKNQKLWKHITTKITVIMAGGISVEEILPGGSFGLLTTLDPSIVKSDSLTGAVVGIPGKLPKVWEEFVLELKLLDRVVGTKEELVVEPVKMNEVLMLNVNSAATVGFVTEVTRNKVRLRLKLPVCAEDGSRVTISRRVGNRYRLIGYGIIMKK